MIILSLIFYCHRDCCTQPNNTTPESEICKILFVGSSYFNLWLQGGKDTYFDMQQKIYDNALKFADEIELVIAPVGWAWNEVLKTKIKELHYLHLSDWNHPSKRGSYLTACVLYATIFKEALKDVNYLADLPADEANYFKLVASEIVLNNLVLWNILILDNP